jgi:hypothetical protein
MVPRDRAQSAGESDCTQKIEQFLIVDEKRDCPRGSPFDCFWGDSRRATGVALTGEGSLDKRRHRRSSLTVSG